jgi:hypothetical protein
VLSLAVTKGDFPMERRYWIARMHAAMNMARRAATAKARLIHFDLAGRYSIKAAESLRPFMLARHGPATGGEREALRPSVPKEPESGSSFRIRPPGPGRRRADGTEGASR